MGKEFHTLTVRKETVDIDILLTYRDGDRKITQFIRITSKLPSRIRKWNQLSHSDEHLPK